MNAGVLSAVIELQNRDPASARAIVQKIRQSGAQGVIYGGYHPEAVAVEQIFLARNPQAALVLGHARGSAMLAAVNSGLAVHEYTALQVKSAVVGYGRASKPQVQQMVKALLNLQEIAQEDAADALGVAICHAHSRTLNQALLRTGQR
jgi:crossover junction endodeoxyribonuclease RuvC